MEPIAGPFVAGSVFAFLAEHRHRLFPADMVADLLPTSRGPATDPGGADRFSNRVAGLARFLIVTPPSR